MFSLFGKKEKAKIVDKVFISDKAKLNAITSLLQNARGVIIITWFDESFERLKGHLTPCNVPADIYLPREISSHNVKANSVLFFEHYPLSSKEFELAQKLQLKEMVFYSSLDEPLFKHLGGDRIISMVEKLGISENEAIEHPMISRALKNAQEKLSTKITIDHTAYSQQEWFSKNLPQQH